MLNTIINKIRADNFAALRGTEITGQIPIKELVLNEILTDLRSRRDLPTKRLDIRLNAANQFTVFLQPKVGLFSPTVKLDFEITSEIEFQDDAPLTLRSLGFLGGPTVQLMRNILLKALKLPDSAIRVEGSSIHIALREALIARGATDIAAIIKSLRIITRSGVLYIGFHLSVK